MPAAPGTQGASGMPNMAGMPPNAPGSPEMAGMMPRPPGGINPTSMMPGGGAMPEAPGGIMPGIGGPAGSNDPNGLAPIGPDTFKHPGTAVMAFLRALAAKDKDQLAQATAKRAPTEAVEKHRKIFAAIVEQSISDDELDEMSTALKGFQVAQILEPKSTGRWGIVIAKQDGRSFLRRTITTRKEKEGWKVVDIDDLYEVKAGLPPVFMRGRGVRRR